MKKRTDNIGALLGIKQKDMAQLLNVHRSQWAMFESGQRNLPHHAKLLLAEMLLHLEEKQDVKSRREPVRQDAERYNYLLAQLQENNRKAIALYRKMNLAQKKYLANSKLQQLTHFLANRPHQKSTEINGHIKSLAARAAVALEQNGAMVVFRYEVQLELLRQQQALLETSLERYHQSK